MESKHVDLLNRLLRAHGISRTRELLMATKLEDIMARASSEVEKWPEWKRSADVKAELRKLEQRLIPAPSMADSNVQPGHPICKKQYPENIFECAIFWADVLKVDELYFDLDKMSICTNCDKEIFFIEFKQWAEVVIKQNDNKQ